MHLYLIRHGYSCANDIKLVTGDKLDQLHPLGIEQARLTNRWIAEFIHDAELFIVSDWGRARQTAELLFPIASWVEDSRLGETNAGSVSNDYLSDFISTFPDFYLSNSNRYPGGESHNELNVRVLACLSDLIKSYMGKTVVAVTHSGPISCILQHVCGLDMSSFPKFIPLNTSVSRVDFKRDSDGIVKAKIKYFSLCPTSLLKNVK